MKIVFLENIDSIALESFRNAGFTNLSSFKENIDSPAVANILAEANVLCIRSRSNINKNILANCKNLLAIGCFCIGTNQVDLSEAQISGVPVFNAPFSNTRSVAELVIGEIIMLFRDIIYKNAQLHRGNWLKTSDNCHEIRGKTLGIIGYGRIGSQLSILAEALGMKVYYYDIESKLPLGNAVACSDINQLLAIADVVTLHIPSTSQTKNLIDFAKLTKMKKGSKLINASRGDVVVIDDLVQMIENKHLSGAAIDVFPQEPQDNSMPFNSKLMEFDNVLLTPHIGGSTKEAQHNIAIEVSSKIVDYLKFGITQGAVNFPNVNLAKQHNRIRISHIHHNVPGMLEKINFVIAKYSLNVASQMLQTEGKIGFVLLDLDLLEIDQSIINELQEINHTIAVRICNA